jgi:hypothetical protein
MSITVSANAEMTGLLFWWGIFDQGFERIHNTGFKRLFDQGFKGDYYTYDVFQDEDSPFIEDIFWAAIYHMRYT